ncbi:hypothetical protein [Sinobaca sp. H24]|uniref:hypothetical protein n=1 Tax=Sinobaca sp. H24 TaxID=2923376 RepID=UPI0020792938|nr:hypothetical protein [Sinobaca sp. H24]
MSTQKRAAKTGADKIKDSMNQSKKRPAPANLFFEPEEKTKNEQQTIKETETKTETSESQFINTNSEEEKENNFWNTLEKKKQKVEDTHKRSTFLIRKDLLNEFDQLSKNQGKGFKTQAINYALEKLIEEMKKR